MGVTSSSSNNSKLLLKIQRKYPEITFVEDNEFFWSSKDQSVHTAFSTYSDIEYWTFLHEIAHSILDHKTFKTDYQLLQMELEAWKVAKKISTEFKITIDQDHIEDCLDTYRDWLHKRSMCTVCKLNGIQNDTGAYQCISCSNTWNVSKSQLCRVYRKQKTPS